MAISTFSNPIPEIISGMLQGHQLAQQMHQQQQADQAFKTRQALDQQNLSMQDIMNQQVLGQAARPVSDMGTVTSQGAGEVPSGIPIQGLGTMPGAPSFTRKADASRTVKYGGRSYELKSPEEQQQTAAAQAAAKQRATSTQMHFSPEEQARFGLASPDVWIPNEHVPAYLGARLTNDTKQTIAAGNNDTRVATNARTNDTRETTNARTNDTRETTNALTNATRSDIAAGVQTGAGERNDATNQTRKDIAKGNNATAVGVADIKHGAGTGQPTPGQANVQRRFDQARQDKAQKEISAIQGKEDALHAQRLQIGQALSAGTMKPADVTTATSKLKSLAFQIGAYQTRKATIAGATQPPKSAEDQADSPEIKAKYPQGVPMNSPDGHSWLRKDGITYFVK